MADAKDTSQGAVYEGAERPNHAANEYNTLDFLIQRRLAQISVAMPVKIVKAPYDKDGNPITSGAAAAIGFIDVQPLVNQVDGYGNAVPHGTVYRLSYHRYQSGAGAFIADPQMNDIGKMVVADRDTSRVRATGAQANPDSARRFDMADGTYYGQQIAGAPNQYFAWTSSGFIVHDKNNNQVVGDNNGLTLTDKNGNSIKMDSNGITLTVPNGKIVTETAGGTPHFVSTVSGTSTVAKADS